MLVGRRGLKARGSAVEDISKLRTLARSSSNRQCELSLWSAALLIIRHDIIPQKFHPNNPSISPQLANLNVLANLKGHDLQIVGNIWIFLQELGSSFFIKYKCFHFGAHCVTFSTNRSSYQKWGLCYIQIEWVCTPFILWSQTTHPMAIYNIYIAHDATKGTSELRPKLRPHRIWLQVLLWRAN